MALFADLGSAKEKIAWAKIWSEERRFSGLIHLVAVMELGLRLFVSSISLIPVGSPALKERGMK
jgi:hypothetical protein